MKQEEEKDRASMKAIVFVDLDGTLWVNEMIPESAVVAIEQAAANGHLVFANTGRARDSAWRALEDLPLSGQVYSLGSEIWLDGTQIYFKPLGSQRTHRLLEEFEALKLGISVEGSVSSFANWKAKMQILEDMPVNEKAAFRFELLPSLDEMNEGDYETAMKLSLVGVEPGSIDWLLEEENMVMTPFGGQGDGTINGEITLKSMTKGTAFQVIQQILGKKYRTIALGDSDNDLPMFEAADMAIAMGNATPNARKTADYVTAPIDKDGLYQAFAYAGLLETPAGHNES